uniref:FBA_2 domain-containing protein n=1 Tax=Caenorhabditis tropicalis TaxID=1561998 RepID=A0A1I7UDT4_9PELO
MNNKPLTYDSLKTVLQYMDPNIRFFLLSRAPSIRTAEKAAPLRIYAVEIDDHKIRVNQTEYKYEVYQVDRNDNVPYLVSGLRLNDRWTCDVDEFGIPDYITKAGGILPGNNGRDERNLFGFEDHENIPDNDGRLRKLERILETEKNRYKQLLKLQPRRPTGRRRNEGLGFIKFTFIRRDQARLYTKEELELLKNKKEVKRAVEYTEKMVKLMEDELLPFQNRRNNIRPKFEIHVFKRQGWSQFHLIERVNYTGAILKVGESLMEFMFSNRNHAIVVNRFYASWDCSLRMPRNMKMRMKHLIIGSEKTIQLVKPIIDESSFPLEKVKVNSVSRETLEMNHEFIQTCKLLKLYMANDPPLELIQNVTHSNVEFDICSDFLLKEDFIALIRNWMETNKPIGNCFTFHTHKNEAETIEILRKVENQIDGAIYENKCVDIPMRNSSTLKLRLVEVNFHRYIKMTVVPFK